MNSIRISIQADEATQDIFISELSDLGAEGFEQTGDTLIAYFPELDFPSYDVQTAIGDYPFTISTVEEQNWNAVWESNFQPVQVNDFCAVRAEFHAPMPGVKHEIVITPKMSFGTGHHATTYMMVEQMEAISFGDKTVFDFGTGTGILAILAEKLGAKSITAIDVDNWSVENAEENAQKNGCTRISLSLSTTIPNDTFDVILANINRNVLLKYMPYLKKALAGRDSLLLLSGLLVSDEEAITASCQEQGLELARKEERSGWISLLFKFIA